MVTAAEKTAKDLAEAAVIASAASDKLEAEKKDLIAKFVKASGYKTADCDGANPRNRTVITTNGGKYQVTAKGNVRRIQGPLTPNEIKAARGEETEEDE
jgi:hypothetical protein